jgi:tellurite resistance protein
MRIPPNFFGISFGLTGLSAAWNTARATRGVPTAVPGAMAILATAVWLILVSSYLAQGRAQIAADLTDPVLAPFLGGAVIVPMILGAELAGVSPTAGRAVVVVFLALTVALGGGLTGQWMLGRLRPDAYHPGYLLPTVSGGLIGAYAAAAVHLPAVAAAAFGIGMVCWLLLGSTVLNRLFFRPLPPPALVPTLAIELLPPVAAGMAWFGLDHDVIDGVACLFGGYAVLMALVQLRFIPVYRRLRFGPGFWVFAFCYCSAAIDALAWIKHARPPGAAGWAIAILVLVTPFVGAIAIRTIVAMARGQFLPSPAQAAAPSSVTTGADL